MWVWEIVGYGYFGGRGRGYPAIEFFCQKMLFFTYFSNNRRNGTKKIWGVGTPSLGAPSPLKFILCSKLGLARCFHSHFAMVGLESFSAVFWTSTLALSPGSTP